MVKLTRSDVLHVAKLAKLDLTDSEINKFLPQLSKIVDHIGMLQKVDTSKVEPTSQTTGLENVFRGDDLKESSLNQDAALSGSDKTYNGYFIVPAILSERTDK
jgi:aspartyl-tRNA(Asn)/glutamyl-tRNA(Gln) amidotransferase subunit C